MPKCWAVAFREIQSWAGNLTTLRRLLTTLTLVGASMSPTQRGLTKPSLHPAQPFRELEANNRDARKRIQAHGGRVGTTAHNRRRTAWAACRILNSEFGAVVGSPTTAQTHWRSAWLITPEATRPRRTVSQYGGSARLNGVEPPCRSGSLMHA